MTNYCLAIAYKSFPKQTWIPLINLPVLLGPTGMMPPATPLNYNVWIAVGTIFNYFVYQYVKSGGKGTIMFFQEHWMQGWLSWECYCIFQWVWRGKV